VGPRADGEEKNLAVTGTRTPIPLTSSPYSTALSRLLSIITAMNNFVVMNSVARHVFPMSFV
jgi:hypothetical protein